MREEEKLGRVMTKFFVEIQRISGNYEEMEGVVVEAETSEQLNTWLNI